MTNRQPEVCNEAGSSTRRLSGADGLREAKALRPGRFNAPLIAECKTKWTNEPSLRQSCVAAVKSTEHWSRDPNGPKSLGDTCKEQFPDNTTLQIECMARGMDADTDAKMRKAYRDAR